MAGSLTNDPAASNNRREQAGFHTGKYFALEISCRVVTVAQKPRSQEE